MAKKRARKADKIQDYSLHTRLIHGRFHDEHWDYRHHVVPPLSSSTAYRLEDAARGAQGFAEFAKDEEPGKRRRAPIYIYDRLAEPTRDMLEEALAFAEEGETSVTFSTGMAAISAALGISLATGEHLVAHSVLYGSTYSLLTEWFPRYKIGVTFADLKHPERLAKAIKPNTRVVYFETPANPNMEMIDIAGVARAVEHANRGRKPDKRVRVIIDNTFATPFCQRPLALGADLVVHSLTKNICGFGTDMGGAVIGARRFQGPLLAYRKDFGGVLSPKAAWPILVYGISTMALRIRQQEATAQEVALYLEKHPKVKAVRYPGLPSFPQYALAKRQMTDYDGNFAPGTMLYFIVRGDPKAARRRAEKVIDHIARNAYTITLAVSLGQIRTLIEHPSSMTHSSVPLEEQVKEGIDPGGVRLSIGLESPRGIIGDLSKALGGI